MTSIWNPRHMKTLVAIVLWVASISTFISLGSLYVLGALMFPPQRVHWLARWGCRGMLLAAGIRLRIEGTFPAKAGGPYVYMFNHTSLLDTFIVIATIPEFTVAIGKAEQFKVPLWGWILQRWGAIPIERSNLGEALHSLSLVENAVREGSSLLIAPEGTRSATGALLPFKKGPFHIVARTEATIVPMLIHGAYARKNKKDWKLSPGVVSVELPGSVLTESHASVETLLARTHALFRERLTGDIEE